MAKGIEAGRAHVVLGTEDGPFNQGIRKAQQRLRGFASSMRNIGGGITAVGGAIAAPFAKAIADASKFQEVMNKFKVVFGDSSGEVKKWGDEFAKSVGRSKAEVAGFLSETQDLLKPMGFAADEATDMSKTVTKLAVDLASFNNKVDADVLNHLKSALVGNGEAMKDYGVILNETTLKQELLNQGLDPNNVSEMEKAQARLNIIMRATTDAQDDAKNSAGSFANQLKSMQGKVNDLSVEVGLTLLPILEKFTPIVLGWIESAGEWVTANQEVIPVIAAVGAGALALGGILLGLSVVASGLSAALGLVSAAAGLLASPFIIGAALAAILGGAFLWATGAAGELWEGVKDTLGAMKRAFEAGGIEAAFEAMWISMAAAAKDAIASILESMASLVESITQNKVLRVALNLQTLGFGGSLADQATGGLRDIAKSQRNDADFLRSARDTGLSHLEAQAEQERLQKEREREEKKAARLAAFENSSVSEELSNVKSAQAMEDLSGALNFQQVTSGQDFGGAGEDLAARQSDLDTFTDTFREVSEEQSKNLNSDETLSVLQEILYVERNLLAEVQAGGSYN